MEEIIKINEIILFEKLIVAWIFGAVIVLLVICLFLICQCLGIKNEKKGKL